MLSKRNGSLHCVHTQCFHPFVCSEFTLAHCYFASKSHSGKACVGKKNYTVWSVYSPNSSGKCFVVLPVKWPMLYSACSFPKWVVFVLCSEMFASLQKAHFIRKPPRGVWHSDFKWNNTAICAAPRSCSNKRIRRVFIYLCRWHYKAMLWGGCVFFFCVCF